MSYQFKLIKRMDFAETDMVGIMHFSHYFRYMEITEHAFYRSLGFGGFMPDAQKTAGWARVHVSMDYFETLRHGFLFRNAGEEHIVAKGKLCVVYIRVDPENKGIKSAPIPAEITDRIEQAPADLLEKLLHGGASI